MMAIWPFRRRRKRGRKLADDGTIHQPEETQPSAHYYTATAEASSSAAVVRRDSKRRKRDSAPSSTTATNNNHSNVVVDETTDSPAPAPAPAPSRRFPGAAFASQSQSDVGNPPLRQPPSTTTFPQRNPPTTRVNANMSQPSLAGNQYPMPTLLGKKGGERNVLRRKSDKRRGSDYAREQEIRNMVESQTFVPRSRSLGADAGNYNVSGGGPSQPLSPEAPDSRALKISAFDAIIPRPILRYKEKSNTGPQPSRDISRSSTTKGKRPVVNRPHLAENDRIDELADDMDAGILRELLERDRRRSMKSHGAQDVLNKKLRQHADRDHQRQSSPPPVRSRPNWPLPAPNRSGSWLENPSKEYVAALEGPSQPSGSQQRSDESALAISSNDHPSLDNRASVASASQAPAAAEQSASDLSRALKSEKRNSGQQFGRSLVGIFRRTSSRLKKRADAKDPSTSSFQSKESFTKTQPVDIVQAPAVPPKSVLRDSAAASSHGTSKFTEHLNDFPVPPTTVAPSSIPSAVDSTTAAYKRASGVGTIDRYSVSAISTADAGDGRTTGGNSPEPRPDSLMLAQSLASIDSEGSWLSGKPSRRLSQAPKNHLLKTPCSTSERLEESTAESGEGDGNTTGDEIFGAMSVAEGEDEQDDKLEESNLSSQTEHRDNATSAADQAPLSRGEEKLHAGVERRPQLVNAVTHARSTEGLFTDYQASAPESNSSPEARGSPAEDDTEIHRATSVDLGRAHARQISAGSAKLLDLSSSRRPSQVKTVDSADANPSQDKE